VKRRVLLSCVVGALGLIGAVAATFATQDRRSPGHVPVAGESPPTILLGRREIPSGNDPFFIRDADVDGLGERLERPDLDPQERRRVCYTMLVWFVYSQLACGEGERRGHYSEAQSLYLTLLAFEGSSKSRDARLESNAHFLISLAWLAWKGSLDGLARERLQLCAAQNEGDYRLAAELLVEKAPVQPPGLEVAVARLMQGDAPAALERIDDLLRKDPKVAGAHYWRGVALYRLGRYPEGAVSLGTALKADSKNPDALEARAACWYAMRDWKRALEDWESVLKLDPLARGRLRPYIDAVREASK